MILFPFSGVGDIKFGSSVDETICSYDKYKSYISPRSGDEETEYIIYQEINGERVLIFSLHEISQEYGIQAVTVHHGPLYISGNDKFDIFTMSELELRSHIGGIRTSDSGGDIYIDYGVCPYFEYEKTDKPCLPSAILVASRAYLDLLLN